MTPFQESYDELKRLADKLGRPRRILLVDDDDVFRVSVKVLLERSGRYVAEGKSGKEAIELLCEDDFDLIITDFRMQDGDGIALVRYVRERDLTRPSVMLLSGYINDPRLCELTEIPGAMTAIVAKPINAQTLEQYVELLTR